ncbi:Predicted dehydrogenase [Salegentibacter echinorum]|uniref:Predicted dehydrogenase n=1 Tax=Salegentibacter echinorum TaxID=1073325 RepID=A0A1M5HHA9_SALEC|nr:Gfo/Idh/MocA family oxidoreductase [Salegentibacter echinorum]SHG15268.1 Predicted dehydrogenase [Salegentibacter echinorum]
MTETKIVWGIIGCGDVAEVKSGPAFQKSANSELRAVMRRNATKAEDFAIRHKVPTWYDDASRLLQDKNINSVYIATPPSTHLKYALQALEAGKNVYLEKPMALSYKEAKEIVAAERKYKGKLTIAHYRRQLPAFIKVKALVDSGAIGLIRLVDIQVLQSKNLKLIANSETNWRINPTISGGGYFHDLAPHHIDLLRYFFGSIKTAFGVSLNQDPAYKTDDIVNGLLSFENGIQGRGIWCFNTAESNAKQCCTIYGSQGKLEFSFSGDKIHLITNDETKTFNFKKPEHIQQPMIEATIAYFLGKESNPCTAEEGLEVAKIMDIFSASDID